MDEKRNIENLVAVLVGEHVKDWISTVHQGNLERYHEIIQERKESLSVMSRLGKYIESLEVKLQSNTIKLESLIESKLQQQIILQQQIQQLQSQVQQLQQEKIQNSSNNNNNNNNNNNVVIDEITLQRINKVETTILDLQNIIKEKTTPNNNNNNNNSNTHSSTIITPSDVAILAVNTPTTTTINSEDNKEIHSKNDYVIDVNEYQTIREKVMKQDVLISKLEQTFKDFINEHKIHHEQEHEKIKIEYEEKLKQQQTQFNLQLSSHQNEIDTLKHQIEESTRLTELSMREHLQEISKLSQKEFESFRTTINDKITQLESKYLDEKKELQNNLLVSETERDRVVTFNALLGKKLHTEIHVFQREKALMEREINQVKSEMDLLRQIIYRVGGIYNGQQIIDNNTNNINHNSSYQNQTPNFRYNSPSQNNNDQELQYPSSSVLGNNYGYKNEVVSSPIISTNVPAGSPRTPYPHSKSDLNSRKSYQSDNNNKLNDTNTSLMENPIEEGDETTNNSNHLNQLDIPSTITPHSKPLPPSSNNPTRNDYAKLRSKMFQRQKTLSDELVALIDIINEKEIDYKIASEKKSATKNQIKTKLMEFQQKYGRSPTLEEKESMADLYLQHQEAAILKEEAEQQLQDAKLLLEEKKNELEKLSSIQNE
mmetsp:Transcript_18096/g.18847  ORF Transcript_18096/g.18847 Transcript_18096/m.18847 type:complete len:656 (-) Transcript_18096:19-1986(-)